MKYSKNQKAAKEFLKWLHGKEHVRQVVRDRERLRARRHHRRGRTTRCGTRSTTRSSRSGPRRAARACSGHAGPPTAKATEAYTKYIITDMYAKAVQGTPPAEAVKWAEGELKKIYET